MKEEKRDMADCLRDEIASDECKAQRNAYYLCQRSMLDMRTRIRGVRAH